MEDSTMENRTVTLKLQLIEDGQEHKTSKTEIKMRTLKLTNLKVYNLHEFHKTILIAFPCLTGRSYKVQWTDYLKDHILIENADDLAHCLQLTQDDYIISIRITRTLNGLTNMRSLNVICDGCEKELYEPSFQCMDCHDFDLCENCFPLVAHDQSHRFRFMAYTRQMRSQSKQFGSYKSDDIISQKEVLSIMNLISSISKEVAVQTDDLDRKSESPVDQIDTEALEDDWYVVEEHPNELMTY